MQKAHQLHLFVILELHVSLSHTWVEGLPEILIFITLISIETLCLQLEFFGTGTVI